MCQNLDILNRNKRFDKITKVRDTHLCVFIMWVNLTQATIEDIEGVFVDLNLIFEDIHLGSLHINYYSTNCSAFIFSYIHLSYINDGYYKVLPVLLLFWHRNRFK